MWKLLQAMQKKLSMSIPITMLLGLTLGYFYNLESWKILILPLTFLMVYPMMINLDVRKIIQGHDIKLQLFTQIINFGIIPFLAFLIGQMFLENPYHKMGLLITALLPTSGMTISWTGFAGGNLKAAVKMTIFGLIIGSIATPFYIEFLLGATIEIPMIQVFKQIIIVVFIPIVAGTLTRKVIIWKIKESKYNQIKGRFPAISTLGVLGIVFLAMALKSKSLIEQPAVMIHILIPIVSLYLFNFVISTVIGKVFFGYQDSIALVYGTVMRNLSIALAIAMAIFVEKGSEVAIIIAFAYVIQVQAATGYLKVSKKIFNR